MVVGAAVFIVFLDKVNLNSYVVYMKSVRHKTMFSLTHNVYSSLQSNLHWLAPVLL